MGQRRESAYPASLDVQFSQFRFGAPVAQLDRVSGYEPEGREFESLQARQLIKYLRAPLAA